MSVDKKDMKIDLEDKAISNEKLEQVSGGSFSQTSGGAHAPTLNDVLPSIEKYTCPNCGATIWVSGDQQRVACKECGACWSLL